MTDQIDRIMASDMSYKEKGARIWGQLISNSDVSLRHKYVIEACVYEYLESFIKSIKESK